MISAFSLRPTKAELEKCAVDYWTGMSDAQRDEEKNTFEAGLAIREGDRTPATLQTIVHWKSPRIVPLFKKNSTEEVKAALDVAVSHTTVAEAMVALIKLQGVGIPVASAILTAIYPERYTVIDFRALETLGYTDVTFYIAYLDFCRDLAKQDLVPAQIDLPAPTKLRALDRALWQWSKENPSSD
jgi:hypothetical protein